MKDRNARFSARTSQTAHHANVYVNNITHGGFRNCLSFSSTTRWTEERKKTGGSWLPGQRGTRERREWKTGTGAREALLPTGEVEAGTTDANSTETET